MNIWTSQSKEAIEARMKILDDLFEEHIVEPRIERGEYCCRCRKTFEGLAERNGQREVKVHIDGGPEYPNGLWLCEDCSALVRQYLDAIPPETREEFSWAEVRDV